MVWNYVRSYLDTSGSKQNETSARSGNGQIHGEDNDLYSALKLHIHGSRVELRCNIFRLCISFVALYLTMYLSCKVQSQSIVGGSMFSSCPFDRCHHLQYTYARQLFSPLILPNLTLNFTAAVKVKYEQTPCLVIP